jgi:hypothetical protein
VRVFVFVLAFVTVATTASGAPARPDGARLAVLDRAPVVVRGFQFMARERVTVRVVVRGGPSATKTLRAGAHGTWTARFQGVSVGLCSSFVVRATGARGSRAGYTEHLPPCGAAP